MKTATESLGERIHRMRRAQGLTSAKLAELAKCSEDTITRLEHDRSTTTIRTLGAVADVLGSTPAELLEGVREVVS